MNGISANSADLKQSEHLKSQFVGREDPDALPAGVNYLNSVQETSRITNRSRSSVYEMIAAGELEAVKDGTRILITGKSIVRRTRNLPTAKIKSKAA